MIDELVNRWIREYDDVEVLIIIDDLFILGSCLSLGQLVTSTRPPSYDRHVIQPSWQPSGHNELHAKQFWATSLQYAAHNREYACIQVGHSFVETL